MSDSDFDAWFKAFPKRHVSHPKEPARNAWRRLEKSGKLSSPLDMLLDAKRFTAECIKGNIYGTCYVPHAATYLNQLRFVQEPIVAPVEQTAAILPEGYEDVARQLIAKIGTGRWAQFFGKATWSNGGNVIKIKAATGFDRQTIEINYAEDLERLTGKQIEVLI